MLTPQILVFDKQCHGAAHVHFVVQYLVYALDDPLLVGKCHLKDMDKRRERSRPLNLRRSVRVWNIGSELLISVA